MTRRTTSLVGLLLYLMVQAVAAMPVQWRMDCLTSGRSVLSWGTGRSCGQQESTDNGTTVDLQCCVYSYVLGSRDAQVKADVSIERRSDHALPVWVVFSARPLELVKCRAFYVQPPPDTGVAFARLVSLRL